MSTPHDEQLAPVESDESPRYSDYDRFASFYDSHFGQFAPRVAPIVDRLMLQVVPDAVRVLDLCCGTGQLARKLVRRGYDVTGVDGSQEMLRFAERNAPGAAFMLEDARRLDLGSTFCAVVSTFDSINHIAEQR